MRKSDRSFKDRVVHFGNGPEDTRHFRESHTEHHRSRGFGNNRHAPQGEVPFRLLLAYFAASLAFHDQDDNYQRDHTKDNPTGFLLSSFTN